MAEHGEDGSNARQRPPGGDGLDPACTRVWRGPGDVIVQEHHERLARGHPGAGGSRRSDEDAADAGREERHRQRRNPPAEAGGRGTSRAVLAHPVNRDGPRRGWSTAAAQAR